MKHQTIHTWETPPKKRGKNKVEATKDCVICKGTGKRRDRKTSIERACAGCKGTGVINKK